MISETDIGHAYKLLENEGAQDNEGDEGGIGKAVRRKKTELETSPYIQRLGEPEEEEVKLWLITFTDVIALMLTFFVMLYSMSVPEEDKWEEISTAISSQFVKKYALPDRPGPQETINIAKIDLTRALSLPYLESLIKQAFEQNGIKNYSITQLSDRMVIALPDNILLPSESPSEPERKKPGVLPVLGDIIGRIKNRIEVIGHARSWEAGVENALLAGAALKSSGYDRDIVARAAAPPAPGEPDTASLHSLDIVIMRDNGLERELLIIEKEE